MLAPFSLALRRLFSAQTYSRSGTVSGWSQQPTLPQSLIYMSGAVWNDTVYLVSGTDGDNNWHSTVYYGTVENGQISAWNTGPSCPCAT